MTYRFYAIEQFLVCYIVADNFMFFAIDSSGVSADDDRQIDPLATWLPQRKEEKQKNRQPRENMRVAHAAVKNIFVDKETKEYAVRDEISRVPYRKTTKSFHKYESLK